MLRRLTVTALVVWLAAELTNAATASPAQSGEGGAGSYAADREATGELIGEGAAVEAVSVTELRPVQTGSGTAGYVGPGPSDTPRSGRGGAAASPCRYTPTRQPAPGTPSRPALGPGEVEMVRTCESAPGIYSGDVVRVDTDSAELTPAPGPAPAVVDSAVLAEIARSELAYPAPVVRSSPPLESGTVARLPTYFWIDNWASTSETASAGPVTATVTATPVRQEWRIHDRLRGTVETVTCEGAGERPEVERAASTAPACGWVPEHSSAGQPAGSATDEPCFGVTVTVTWGVAWSSNIGGGGDLGAGTSTADACLVVGEVQAVVTDEG